MTARIFHVRGLTVGPRAFRDRDVVGTSDAMPQWMRSVVHFARLTALAVKRARAARRRDRAVHRRALMRGRREAHAMGLDVRGVVATVCARGWSADCLDDHGWPVELRSSFKGLDHSAGPYVCPGCYTVAGPCPLWCVDGQIERAQDDHEAPSYDTCFACGGDGLDHSGAEPESCCECGGTGIES